MSVQLIGGMLMPTEKEILEAEIKSTQEKLAELQSNDAKQGVVLQQHLLSLLQKSRELGNDVTDDRQIQIFNPINSQSLTVNQKSSEKMGTSWFEREKLTPENFDRLTDSLRDSTTGEEINSKTLPPEVIQKICNAFNYLSHHHEDEAAKKCGLTLKREERDGKVRTTVTKDNKPASLKDMNAFFKEEDALWHPKDEAQKNPDEKPSSLNFRR